MAREEFVRNIDVDGETGGALIDAIGYRKTFLFTCGFHAAMGLVLLPLVAVVPRGGGRGAA